MIDRAVSLRTVANESTKETVASTPLTSEETPKTLIPSHESSPKISIDDRCLENDDDLETISTPSEQFDFQLALPSIRREPFNPDQAVEAKDMSYFNFFLNEMVHIASDFKELFPTYIRDSFTYSVENSALRHSVLGASAIIVDKRQGRDMIRFHHHRQRTYSHLRQQLASGQHDAPLVAAIFWTQYMDLIYGDFDAAMKHNQGLFLVLKTLLNQHGSSWTSGSRPSIPPLCMIIWRHGIRSDIVMSHWMNGNELTFPPIPRDQECLHRAWMEEYARVSVKEDAAEWAAASFALECFVHRACHIANNFIKYREDGQFPPEVSVEFENAKQSLIQEAMEWWERPVIQQARINELVGIPTPNWDDTLQEQFLEYPRLPPIQNPLFVWLRNFWYANYIYISLLNYSPHEDRPHDPLRIECAVEICRVYAANGFHNFPRWDHWCIIFAGVAFAESTAYERESRWIHEHMNMNDGPAVSWPIIGKLHGRIAELWGKQYFSWDIGN
jgi:hypothetical protein